MFIITDIHTQKILKNCAFQIDDASPPPIAQAEKSWLIHQKTPEEPVTGLQTAWLGLRFSLWPGYFRRGVVRVTCTASILEVYNDSSEAIVKGDLPHHASIMEGRASDSAG